VLHLVAITISQEAAEKANIKATEAYEKGLKKLISRTEPLGYDRNFNGVYFSLHDPSLLLVEAIGTPPKISVIPKSPELDSLHLNPNRSWYIIETKSLFDKYLSSLDIRGIREESLFEELSSSGLSSVRRFLFDDIKEKASLLAQKRDFEELQRKLKNAKIACAAEEEGGRRSGRLASLAQIELQKAEEEIKFAKEIAESRMVPSDIDYRELTGLSMLSNFESNMCKRSSYISEDQQLCSPHWPSDSADFGGVVSLLVSEMLSLEKRCNCLAPWGKKDIKRKDWINDLKNLATAWSKITTMNLGLPSPEDVKRNSNEKEMYREDSDDESQQELSSSGRKKKRKFGIGSDWVTNGNKKQKHANEKEKMKAPQIISLLKRPLLDLEARIFTISGLEMATKDTDEAGEDISGDDIESPKEQLPLHLQWKKKIHSLSSVSSIKSTFIRETIVSAIACARKSHQHEVVVDLRSALILHHPQAAGAAKAEAIKVLEKYGGYTGSDDDSSDDNSKTSEKEDSLPQRIESLLCGEAMMMSGSLQGDDDADRFDWKDAIKGSRTISRLAAIAESFMKRANDELAKIEANRDTLSDAIAYWESNSRKSGKTKKRKRQKKEEYTSGSEIWADVEVTAELVMGKVEGYPWWPSRICKPKDKETADSLELLNKVLISYVGQGNLRAVDSDEEIGPFAVEECAELDNLEDYSKTIRDNLQESIILAKRISLNQKKPARSNRRSSRLFLEEKKSAN